MNSPPGRTGPWRGRGGKNSNDGRTLPRKQQQLQVFRWIATTFPIWFRRPDHSRMLKLMFERVITEEAHE